jgi:acetate---CoA ligase (ADP-forming)
MPGLADLGRILAPSGVVIVGAKETSPSSYGVVEALSRVGYRGRIFAVNRSATAAHGLAAAPSCTALGEPADAAVLLVPAAAVGEVLGDVARAGIRTAVVLSSGWAEAGPAGVTRQRALASQAAQLGLTLFGPNCLGFLNVAARTGAWIASVPPGVRPGPVAIVSQSGGVGNALADLAAEFDLGLSCVVTTGNEAMVTTTDVLEYLVGDPGTTCIALFAEAIADPPRFLAVAGRAAQLGKAIVMLKAGRSALAARNALSHTASLVGDDQVVDAALRQHGVVRVASLEELVLTAGVIARAGPLRAPGLAVVSISGGSAGIVADEADRLALELPQFDEAAAGEIRAALPGFASAANPLDITGASLGDEFAKVLAIADRQDAFGAVAVLCNVPGYQSCKGPGIEGLLATIAAGLGSVSLPGFLLSQTIAHLNERGRQALRAAGLTGLPGLSLGITALAHLSRWSRWQQSEKPGRAGPPVPPPGLPAGLVSEWTARQLLEPAGVPFVPAGLARSAAEAADLAAGFGGPVAVKLVSPDVAHKSDLGAVRLGAEGPPAVRQAYADVLAAAAAAPASPRVEGVLVAPLRRGGVEILAGVTRDPQWGLALAVGLGGVQAEVTADVSVRLLPVTTGGIAQMLAELRGSAVLDGWRAQPAVDRGALVAAIASLADAAWRLGDALESLEVNPLRADQHGTEALDVLMEFRRAAGGSS